MLRDDLKQRWETVVQLVSQRFGEGEEMDLDAIIFIIGLQESGLGYRKYRKDDKVNLFHIGICKLLEPYGYYRYSGVDQDGWPHFDQLEKLPPLKPGEQSLLMKEAVVRYFEESGLLEA